MSKSKRPPGVPQGKPITEDVMTEHRDPGEEPAVEPGAFTVKLNDQEHLAAIARGLAAGNEPMAASRTDPDCYDTPPVEEFAGREIITRSEVVNPDPDADRWLAVDVERMTGKVPHLAERGGMGPTDETVILVNEQVTSCPYYDPGDGIWGGVSVGDIVAVFPPASATWTPGIVVELFPDAGIRAFVGDLRYFVEERIRGNIAKIPHQAKRKPGEACWAHRAEDFVTVGRMAAEMELGIGGAAYEEEQYLLTQPTPTEDVPDPRAGAESTDTQPQGS